MQHNCPKTYIEICVEWTSEHQNKNDKYDDSCVSFTFYDLSRGGLRTVTGGDRNQIITYDSP